MTGSDSQCSAQPDELGWHSLSIATVLDTFNRAIHAYNAETYDYANEGLWNTSSVHCASPNMFPAVQRKNPNHVRQCHAASPRPSTYPQLQPEKTPSHRAGQRQSLAQRHTVTPAASGIFEIHCRCTPSVTLAFVQPWSGCDDGDIGRLLVWSMNGQLGDELDKKHIFHHAVGVTPLFSKLPVQSKLVIKMAILPIQDLLY